MEGYDIGIPDGVYGERTVDAIKKYQASMGLEVDGIIGDSTYMKLMGKRMPQYAGYGVSRGRSYRGSGAARRLISRAFEYVGVPYCLWGNDAVGFDCSGYTQYVLPSDWHQHPQNSGYPVLQLSKGFFPEPSAR